MNFLMIFSKRCLSKEDLAPRIGVVAVRSHDLLFVFAQYISHKNTYIFFSNSFCNVLTSIVLFGTSYPDASGYHVGLGSGTRWLHSQKRFAVSSERFPSL